MDISALSKEWLLHRAKGGDGCAFPTGASYGPQSRYGVALKLTREAEIKIRQQEKNEKREPITLVLDHEIQGRAGSLPAATEEITNALEKHHLFLYIGHGTGEQYIPMCRVNNLEKCAAAVLMGCSSGLPYRRGRYVPNSVPTSLLLALWDVTSDINRFGKAMLEGWFRERSDDYTSSERVGLFMADTRDACTVQFLTGAAPVCYGVPTTIKKTKKKKKT